MTPLADRYRRSVAESRLFCTTKWFKLLKLILEIIAPENHCAVMAETTLSYKDDSRAYTKDFALSRDARDPLSHFRREFIIPSKKDLKRKTLAIDEGICMHTVHL